MDDPDFGRRRILKVATSGLGVGVGLAVVVPAARYLAFPVTRKVVIRSVEPIDVGSVHALPKDGAMVRVSVVAPVVRDAWTTATDVPLGTAWLRREGTHGVVALSGTCPHLGCAIALDAKAGQFGCPCHDSAFSLTGTRITGPAKRDLDPLDTKVDEKGRVWLTWIRYRTDTPEREPV